ncbi:precorrin-6Y C5,15-methyltransferase (decarboxylating) subunit CbiT [Halodesulfurarchaeum sp.]|uniref:precorrin-6Y C5,15-methyltransferase (decarboxylating) subunit CbiT n=1 Tax=Halodesulfurarchaeum sp. TaxID=1980530 RepID=UPI001BC0CC1E|nr:precorrin-6Y C5,15-methyltransferase (decarboxylating) subunit CbiT [Halodesulfurarchaeum sp.]
MGRISLPHTTAPGPTKPEVRAILLRTLDLQPEDHFVDVGAGTGAVTIEAAQVTKRVTAIEKDGDRVDAIRANLEASASGGRVTVRHATAPNGLPDSAEAVFLGGTQNLEAVLNWVTQAEPRQVVLNAARLETATNAIESFENRGFDPSVRRISVGRGESLAGETAIVPDRPVYMITGTPGEDG